MQHTLKPRSVSVRVCVCESVECASMAGWLTLSYCGILCMHKHSARTKSMQKCKKKRKYEFTTAAGNGKQGALHERNSLK